MVSEEVATVALVEVAGVMESETPGRGCNCCGGLDDDGRGDGDDEEESNSDLEAVEEPPSESKAAPAGFTGRPGDRVGIRGGGGGISSSSWVGWKLAGTAVAGASRVLPVFWPRTGESIIWCIIKLLLSWPGSWLLPLLRSSPCERSMSKKSSEPMSSMAVASCGCSWPSC